MNTFVNTLDDQTIIGKYTNKQAKFDNDNAECTWTYIQIFTKHIVALCVHRMDKAKRHETLCIFSGVQSLVDARS